MKYDENKRISACIFYDGNIYEDDTHFGAYIYYLKCNLDEKTFNYGKDLLSKMQNVLTNQVNVNISTTIINSKFNENEVLNYKSRIERALLKYDELFTNNNFSEDFLRSILREFEPLRNELDTITLTDINELDISTKENLKQKMDDKIFNLKEVYKTYYGNDYKPSGFKM